MPTAVTHLRGASSPSVDVSPLSVNLTSQGSFVEVAFKTGFGGPTAGGSRRGVVNAFSSAARKRLLNLFNRMELHSLKCVFLTLTYGQDFPSPQVAKKHKRLFLARVQRRWPLVSVVWRMEFQDRGAPHFHLVLFNLPYVPKEEIQALWAASVPEEFWDTSDVEPRYPFTRIEMITSKKRLLSYVSKYVAKRDAAGGVSGFNLFAYLHAGQFIHPQTGEICGSVGRWWGVHNADALPMAVAVVVELVGSYASIYALRRSARRVWRGCSRRRRQGFSLYVSDAQKWFDYWLQLHLDERGRAGLGEFTMRTVVTGILSRI